MATVEDVTKTMRQLRWPLRVPSEHVDDYAWLFQQGGQPPIRGGQNLRPRLRRLTGPQLNSAILKLREWGEF